MFVDEDDLAAGGHVAERTGRIGLEIRANDRAACQPHEDEPRARSAIALHDPPKPQAPVFREPWIRWRLLLLQNARQFGPRDAVALPHGVIPPPRGTSADFSQHIH